MRLMMSVTCLVLGIVIVAGNSSTSAAPGGDPKYTISDVMKKAHSGKMGILKKVTGGTATDAEAKELLAMYEALGKNKAPKGDEKAWKTKTDALVAGAKLVVDGKKDDGVAKLKTASDCKGCHSVHKG